MTEIMRLSEQYAPTLKEDPTDAEIASHRLLVRAGMIRKVTSGVYTYLPARHEGFVRKSSALFVKKWNATGCSQKC